MEVSTILSLPVPQLAPRISNRVSRIFRLDYYYQSRTMHPHEDEDCSYTVAAGAIDALSNERYEKGATRIIRSLTHIIFTFGRKLGAR